MSHIFISYVREDSDRVDRLARSLAEAGLETWVDREDMRAGENWHVVVPDVLKRARFFVACFSKNVETRERSAMFVELRDAAEELRYRLPKAPWFLPVLFDPVEIPEFAVSATENLGLYERVELFRDWDAGVERLLKEIAPEGAARQREPRVLSQFGVPQPEPAPTPEPRPAPLATWAVASIRRVTRGVQHGTTVQALTFNHDRTQLITAGGQLTRFWRLPRLEPLIPLDNGVAVRAAAFGAAGRRFATAGEDRCVRLWDPAGGGRLVHTLDHRDTGGDDESWIPAMALSGGDAYLATGGVTSELRVWNTVTGERVEPVPTLKHIRALAFGPYDRILAIGDHSSRIHLVDVVSGQEFEPMEHPRTHVDKGVAQLLFSPDGARLISLAKSGSLRAWDVETAAEERQLWREDKVACVAFGRSPAVLAGADAEGGIYVWDTETGFEVFRQQERGGATKLALSPDGAILATVGADVRARVYDIRSGDASVLDENFLVRKLAFSQDGRLLATAGVTRPGTSDLVADRSDAVRLWTGVPA